MNIFRKKLDDSNPLPPPDPEPLALFQSLFHKEGYSYLRGIQEEVLTSWHAIRSQRDVLCKMNTGSGKTLVSLMMLYSKAVEGIGPSLYLCPDRQLLEQARIQAELYGIPVCEVEQSNNSFPSDFLNSKSILLCTFQKLFNSRSIFERDNIQVGSIVIDDAHVCLDIARSATTLNLKYGHDLTQRVLSLFEDELKYQAAGTYSRLIAGDPYAKILKVPYWVWISREKELIDLFGEFSENDELKFKWGLISDDLSSFECFMGPDGIEVAPIHVPYHNIKTFDEAKHRYILSATFEDQIDLIKDLGIDKVSIQNALIPKDRKDIGQRLILAPQRFDSRITDEQIMSLVKNYADQDYNVAVMVPSSERASRWVEIGGKVVVNDTINQDIEHLKSQKGQLYVFVNRYDGVDLNGDMCRVLVLDGYPSFSSYSQVYSEVRLESVKASLKAQIIEQGLGRSVRSGSDYCVVLLMGNDLLQFVGSTSNLQYFTPVTRKQLELGLSLLDGESGSDSLKIVQETAELCLVQDNNWREFHSRLLSNLDSEASENRLSKNLEVADHESSAIQKFRSRDFTTSSELILKNIVDSSSLDLNEKQKAWYFERAANYLYSEDVSASNDLQIKAASIAPHMLQPKNGFKYTKIVAREEQAIHVHNFIKKFSNSQDFKIYFENLMQDLQFSPDIPHKKFEYALADVGRLIGFYTQEPEHEFGNGPDVLWVMTDGHYLVLEAKSRAIHDAISRDNIGQLLQSGEWFKSVYGTSASHNLVTIQPPNIKDWNVNPSPETRVIDSTSLDSLRDNLRRFVDGLINSGGPFITVDDARMLISAHELTPEMFRNAYLKKIKN